MGDLLALTGVFILCIILAGRRVYFIHPANWDGWFTRVLDFDQLTMVNQARKSANQKFS